TTINNFDRNHEKASQNKLQLNRIHKFFQHSLPDEWGGNKKGQDPYTFSINDSDDDNKEKDKQEKNEKDVENKDQNAYEKHYSQFITREQLGNAGWTLLHMISATYPVEVTKDFVDRTNLFLNLFGQFYPCKECAQHFLEHTKDFQFKGRGREDFMEYMCQLHNIVNKSLKKEEFDCSKIQERWGGNCGCSSKDKKPDE
ncbi:hypothetical protein IMG5_130280, partial [Ichthyophthirius multifiliis]